MRHAENRCYASILMLRFDFNVTLNEMYATPVDIEETDKDLAGTGLERPTASRKRKSAATAAPGPPPAEDSILDIHLDPEALMDQTPAQSTLTEDLSGKNLLWVFLCYVDVCMYVLYVNNFASVDILVKVCMEMVKQHSSTAIAGSSLFSKPPITKDVAQKAVDKIPAKMYFRQVKYNPMKPSPHPHCEFLKTYRTLSNLETSQAAKKK